MTRFQATGPRVNYTPQEGPKAGDQLIGLYNMWQSISPETRNWIAGLFKSNGEESPVTTEQDNLNREMFQAEQAANASLQRGLDKDFNGQDAFEAAIDAAMHASDDYKNSQQDAFNAAEAAKIKAQHDLQNQARYQAEQAVNAGLQRGLDKDFNGQDAFEAAIDAAMPASDDYKNSQQAAADASMNAIDDFKKRQQAAELKEQQRARGRHNLGLDWPVVIAPYPSFIKGPF